MKQRGSAGSVFVTDGRWRKSLAAVRSLGKAGLRVTVGDTSPYCTSFFSKYRDRYVVYPDPKMQPEAFLAFLEAELKECPCDVLLPMEDETLLLLAEHRERFEPFVRLPLAPLATLWLARDKAKTLEIASRLALPMPRTFYPRGPQELERLAAEIPLPVVIKPRVSSGSRGLRRACSREAMLSAYREVSAEYPEPLVQEEIPDGGDAFGVSVLMDADSRVRAFFTHRRLREYPIAGGPSTLREGVHNEALEQQAFQLLKEMRWQGMAMVEFKADPRDGRAKLMEVNPRYVGSLALAVFSDVDFPVLQYRLAMGEDIGSTAEYPSGRLCRWLLPGDILHFLSNPRRFEMKPSFFDFWDPNQAYDILSVEDPGPVAGFLVDSLRFLLQPGQWRYVFGRGKRHETRPPLSRPFVALGSVFGLGFLPFGAAWGSLAGLGAAYFLALPSIWMRLAIAVATTVLGLAVTERLKNWGKDPSWIVIDELAGVLFAVVLVPGGFMGWAAAFFLFRFFDNAKPYPIRSIEALAGGWGVMFDDVMAGLYSLGCLLALRSVIHL